MRPLLPALPWLPRCNLAALAILCFPLCAAADDWPMWRRDPGRTADSPAALPENLALLWSRRFPAPAPAYRDSRLGFDATYEPVVLGKRLFVGSNVDDSVRAFDTETGEELWKFSTDGPVRLAPAAGDGRVLFGSDDGCLYCLRASDGALIWKHRAVPSDRRVLGNGRLISVWPVRGGPVLHEGRVYFAAGVWPVEGTFVFCLDAATGAVLWRNDRAAYVYGIHPHNAESYGGLAPQGYLLIDGEDLVVPNSQAYPARFDLETGKLKELQLPAPGRLPGGWFASTPSAREEQKLKRRGLLSDRAVNAKPHEDKMHNEGLPGIRDTIRTGDREWSFGDGLPGIDGTISSLAAADEKLFAVTSDGSLYCLGKSNGSAPANHQESPKAPASVPGADLPGSLPLPRHGYAVVLGTGDGSLVAGLAAAGVEVIAIDSRTEEVERLRRKGWPRKRTHFIAADPARIELPPYLASVLLLDESLPLDVHGLRRHFEVLRPYGGQLLSRLPRLAELAATAGLKGAAVKRSEGWTAITREGPLEGATNYLGGWAASEDPGVRSPMGLLWYGDSIVHFKRSPQPKFIDGVMISNPKDWTDASTRTGKVDYRLLETVFSDVYTGRVLAPDEAPELRQRFSTVDRETIQPSQYRPPIQKDDWKPEPPSAGMRTNPLTGETEPRVFPKSYGCDGGYDYGLIYTMRSGTPAFYDKRIESGTVNISGPRSGCTNSVIPANGLLNLPFFYEGCTCSYPLPVALALVSKPDTFEQWASWGAVEAGALDGKLQRLGLNFGAPGDRVARDGTLWLDVPNVGGPSPALSVATEPDLAALEPFYRHSLFVRPGRGWPWVAGSGLAGVRSVTLAGLKPGAYTLRLTFSEPDADRKPGERLFRVAIDGKTVRENVDPVADGKGPHGAATFECAHTVESGTLRFDLVPKAGEPVISGIEIVPAKSNPAPGTVDG